jgi:hypothetical protein
MAISMALNAQGTGSGRHRVPAAFLAATIAIVVFASSALADGLGTAKVHRVSRAGAHLSIGEGTARGLRHRHLPVGVLHGWYQSPRAFDRGERRNVCTSARPWVWLRMIWRSHCGQHLRRAGAGDSDP